MNTAKNYDLYGFRESRLEVIKGTVASALNLDFATRDSSYLGLYYRSVTADGDEFILQSNRHASSDDWAEGGFKQYPSLLYATTGAGQNLVQDVITALGGRLLRRELL